MTNELEMFEYLHAVGLTEPHKGVPHPKHLVFETFVGSWARGVNRPNSDLDVAGVFAPTYDQLYPDRVPGFGPKTTRKQVVQVPDLNVTVDAVGNLKVDLLAMDLVHFFNNLIKPSPNHVEFLFFRDPHEVKSPAGKLLVAGRQAFLTQALLSKYVAAGKSIMYNRKNPATSKDYALAARFFCYATHLHKEGTIKPLAVRPLNMRMLELDVAACEARAKIFEEAALDAEASVSSLPTDVDVDVVNNFLEAVLLTHWMSLGGTERG